MNKKQSRFGSGIFDSIETNKNASKYSSTLIEEIINSIDILEVMENEYDLAFESPTSKGWWHTNCPLPGHRDSTPSFGVNPELKVFKCFGCNAKGNIFTFVRLVESLSFQEAITKLSILSGINALDDGVVSYRVLKDIDATVKSFFDSHNDSKLPGGLSPVEYLRAIAERLRTYEKKVLFDKDELQWVDSVYFKIDDMEIHDNHKGLSDIWYSLASEMKSRYLLLEKRKTLNA